MLILVMLTAIVAFFFVDTVIRMVGAPFALVKHSPALGAALTMLTLLALLFASLSVMGFVIAALVLHP